MPAVWSGLIEHPLFIGAESERTTEKIIHYFKLYVNHRRARVLKNISKD